MNLLQVVHQFLPEHVGGTEVYLAGLASRLQARGHQVAVLAGASTASGYEYDGVPVRTVLGGLHGPHGPSKLFLSTFGNREAERAFSDLLDRVQPHVVHVHHLLGLSTRLVSLAQRRGIPVCVTLHDYWFMCPKSQLLDHREAVCGGPRAGLNCARCAASRIQHPAAMLAAPLFVLRERRVQRSLAAADLVLAPSRFMASMALARGFPAQRVRYLPFGVEKRSGAVAIPVPGTGPLRVTYLGGMDPSKGLHVLAQAAAALPGGLIEVRIYADLSTDPVYAQSLEYAPVNLMGPVPRERVPEVLARTDILAVPSLWYENSPMVIAEAQAAGVPIIASHLGALPERVEHEKTGLLFPPGDARALAAALHRLAGDRALLHRLRENVNSQPTPSREAHVDAMEQVYAELSDRARQ